jgi:DNA-binding transcriptional ArsR family regulator
MYKALCHPLRREILAYLIEHSTGSPSQMAKAIDAPLPDISHHAKQLVRYGAAELIEERPTRRGSAEKIYRPTARVIISTEEVEKMSVVDRQVFAGQIIQKVCDDLRKGFQRGSFARRSDWNLARTLLDVDEEGLRRLLQLQEQVEEEMYEVQTESLARMVKSQDSPIRVSVSQLCFIKNI